MKNLLLMLIFVATLFLSEKMAMPQQDRPPSGPPLMFPAEYRQWVYLSSGLNMQYKGEPQPSCKEGKCPPLFENVFVTRDAYEEFASKRVWPAGTVMVLERRCSAQRVSIDTSGSVQEKLFLVAASQKTTENGWNYYLFGGSDLTCQGSDPRLDGETLLPASNSSTNPKECWQCHRDHGEVDNTFVQFYPTLKSFSQRPSVGQ